VWCVCVCVGGCGVCVCGVCMRCGVCVCVVRSKMFRLKIVETERGIAI